MHTHAQMGCMSARCAGYPWRTRVCSLLTVVVLVVGPLLVVCADHLQPPVGRNTASVSSDGASMGQNSTSRENRTRAESAVSASTTEGPKVSGVAEERLDSRPLSVEKNDHPVVVQRSIDSDDADTTTDDESGALEEDPHDQLLTAGADMVRLTLGPAAFWLKYDASPEELTALRAAEALQHSLDSISREMMVEKDQLRHTHQASTAALCESRDKHLDAIPQYWSRRWASASPIFWQELYWARRSSQEEAAQASGRWAPKGWRFLAVDDEAFLTHGLSSLRCEVTDAAVGGGSGGDMVTIRFQFNDAPGVVFPFHERHLYRSMPLSLAQRFATGGVTEQTDDAAASMLPMRRHRKHRTLGDGSVVSFRPEYAEAGTSSKQGDELNLPPPNSFFALFAPSVFYDALPDDLWVHVQSRLGQLAADACQVTARCCDDDETVGDGSSVLAGGTPADAHDAHYDQWEAQVAADAAAWAQHRGVDEL